MELEVMLLRCVILVLLPGGPCVCVCVCARLRSFPSVLGSFLQSETFCFPSITLHCGWMLCYSRRLHSSTTNQLLLPVMIFDRGFFLVGRVQVQE